MTKWEEVLAETQVNSSRVTSNVAFIATYLKLMNIACLRRIPVTQEFAVE